MAHGPLVLFCFEVLRGYIEVICIVWFYICFIGRVEMVRIFARFVNGIYIPIAFIKLTILEF